MPCCNVESCERNADRVWSEDRSKRICETHFKRWEKTGKFSIDRPDDWGLETKRKYKEKECVHCNKVKKIAAKGLCRACYQRQNKTGSLEYQRKGIINICTEEYCSGNVVSNGLCDKHRMRLERYGQLDTLRSDDWGTRTKHPLYIYWTDTKRRETLNISKEWKENFWSFVNIVKERPSKNHFLRAVDLNKELGQNNWQWIEGITKAERHMVNKAKQRDSERNRAKVSAKERESLLIAADNKCEICGEKPNIDDSVTGKKKNKLCVDHCHVTGKLRGILCSNCNIGIGNLKDSTELLRKAILYLERKS